MSSGSGGVVSTPHEPLRRLKCASRSDPAYRVPSLRLGCRFVGMRSIVTLVYVVAGVVIAASHHYFAHASTLKPILSAVLAVALWPLLLLGISLHIT